MHRTPVSPARRAREKLRKAGHMETPGATTPLRRRELWLGAPGTRVAFSFEDLCRHTMIFGSSGSGKTTRAFNPMLQAMLRDLKAGAFIIAPKSEAVEEAMEMARRAGRPAIL